MNIFSKLFYKMKVDKKKKDSPRYEVPLGFDSVSLFSHLSRNDSFLTYYKHWVYTCINKIAVQVSSYPFAIYTYKDTLQKQKGKNAEKIPVEGHPLLDVFNNPNPLQTRQSLIQHAIIRLELNGFFAFHLPKFGGKDPLQCWVLPLTDTGSLQPIIKNNTLQAFVYIDGVDKKEIPIDEIIYVNYPNPKNIFAGMSPVSSQVYPYNIDDFLSKLIYSVFKNGAVFGNHFTTDQQLKETQVKELLELIASQYSGALEGGKPIITHSGLKLDNTPLRSPMENLMIKEVAEFARDKLITSFNLTPGKIGLVTDVNRATMEVLDTMFIQECIKPKVNFIQTYIQKYINEYYDSSLVFEILVNDIVDKEYRLKEKQLHLSTGYSSINQERAKDGEEPVPWGDYPIMPLTYNQIGKESIEPQQQNEIKTPQKEFDTTKAAPNKKIFTFRTETLQMKQRLVDVWYNTFQKYFNDLFIELSRKLKEEGKKIDITIKGFGINKRGKWLKDNANQLDNILFDKEKERLKLMSIVKQLFVNCLLEYGTLKLGLFGIKEPYNLETTAVENWLGNKLKIFSTELIEETYDEIKLILREGFREGLSIFEIGTNIRDRFTTWKQYRAMTIAQTEVNAACNFAEIDALKQKSLDKVLKKFWINESNARETHQLAGKTYTEKNPINLDDLFKVGNDKMIAPGNGSLPEENINCRCSIGYVKEDSFV